MEGKVALVTGANTGIGLETARGLYRAGAHVVLACRNKGSAEKAMESIKASVDTSTSHSGHGTVEYMHLDLASLDNVRTFAREFRRRKIALNVLVNNAGMNSFSVQKGKDFTDDGFDRLWQVNFLGHFLLTTLLVDSLQRGGRIVNLSSVTHRLHWSQTDFNKFSPRTDTSASPISSGYSDSKLAMAMISYEWQRRLAADGRDITVHTVNPGAVNSDIWRDFPCKRLVEALMFKFLFLSPSQGAATSLAASTAPELGDKRTRYLSPYWHPASSSLSEQAPSPTRWSSLLRLACPLFDFVGPFAGAKETLPAAAAHDPAQCKALYQLSEQWVAKWT